MRCAALVGVIALASAALADAAAPLPALPTPYTAEQIRDAWQPGLRVETRTRAGGRETLERLVVLSATAEACTIRRESLAASGSAGEPPRDFTATWGELRDHARFAAASATRERAECHSPLGAMPGWRYVVAQPNGDTLTMCFADAAPGPPVEYESARAGEVVSRTEHVRYERPRGAEEGS